MRALDPRCLAVVVFVGLAACKKSEELPPLAGTEARDCDATSASAVTTLVPWSPPICDDGGDAGCETDRVYCQRLCPVLLDGGGLLTGCIVVEDAGTKLVECTNETSPCQ